MQVLSATIFLLGAPLNLVRSLVAPAIAGLLGVTVAGASAGASVGASPVAGQPRLPVATGGSMTGGDSYFPLDGNGGYDVAHYRIRNTYRPGDDRLSGRTVLRAVAGEELSRFHLDLALAPVAVSVDGRRARFSKPNAHELRVIPAEPLASGAAFTVRVDYHGRPASTRAAGLSPFFHEPGEGLALGEPQIGPWWFAANETPKDKATYDIAVRVPKGREAVSNGELVSQATVGSWTTWRWQMTDPMVTYLAFFLAGDLELERGRADGRPYVYAVSARLPAAARDRSFALLRRTPGIVSWLEGRFGDYPFRSVGGVVTAISHLDFALEAQSRPVYPYVGGPDPINVSLVVHEQAHQWFGNDVSVRRWKDLWLNEGLATYVEWLYAEEHGGKTVDEELDSSYRFFGPASSFWALQVSDPGPDEMWSDPVYRRGAMMLAALGNRIGEAQLEALLRRWIAERREGHGTGPAFRALAEEVSGEQLDTFFTEWLDDEDRPERTAANGLT